MPKKSKSKSGGAFAYAKLFDYPLSPCYNPTGNKPIPKLGWHAGGAADGATCDSEPTVLEMGVIDRPYSNQPSPSEIAWPNRYSCPGNKMTIQGLETPEPKVADVKVEVKADMKGGSKILQKIESQLQNKQKSAFSVNALKGGKEKVLNVVNTGSQFVLSITDKQSNSSSYFESKSQKKILEQLKKYNLLKYNKSKKL